MKNPRNSSDQMDRKQAEGVGGVQSPIHLPAELCRRLDQWARSQPDRPSRPEAIRRLLETALADQQSKPGRASISVSDLNASNDD